MNSFYSVIVFILPVGFAIIYRIKVEESVLLIEFGDDYSEYAAKTKKLIPGIF
jgi:protein-S-isoprenylcysteine O-methyltransferase Ste14